MSDPNIIKVLAPEQIPQPLMNRDAELYKYTKDLYDFLRRLFQNLALILVDVSAGTSEMSFDRWYTVDKNTTGNNYLDTRDWRGRFLDVRVSRPFTTGDPGGKWDGMSAVVDYVLVGVLFDDSGAPADWNFATATAIAPATGTLNFYFESGTGRIYFTITGYTSDWEFRLQMNAGGKKSEPDQTVT